LIHYKNDLQRHAHTLRVYKLSFNSNNTYIHTYIHTYIPTYIPTYLPTYIHTYIHTCLCACVCMCMLSGDGERLIKDLKGPDNSLSRGSEQAGALGEFHQNS